MWLGDIGARRSKYVYHAMVDLLLYIPVFGAFLLVVTARLLAAHKVPESSLAQFALLIPVKAMVCDVFETALFLWTTVQYPAQISRLCRSLVGQFTMVKWVLLAASVFSIVCIAIAPLPLRWVRGTPSVQKRQA